MSARDIALLLDDMLDCVLSIQQYSHGLTQQTFLLNALVQDAVLRRLEILGEAANRLPLDYRSQHQEIPWGAIIGMRNRLIHGYFLIDLDVVWNTIQTDVPMLETPLRTLRQSQP